MDGARSFVLSAHAQERTARRNISSDTIARVLTLANNRVHVGGGIKACTVTRNRLQRLRGVVTIAEAERMRSVVVLVHPASGTVITAFRGLGAPSRRYRRR